MDKNNPERYGDRPAAFYLYNMNESFGASAQLMSFDSKFSADRLIPHGISTRRTKQDRKYFGPVGVFLEGILLCLNAFHCLLCASNAGTCSHVQMRQPSVQLF